MTFFSMYETDGSYIGMIMLKNFSTLQIGIGNGLENVIKE